MSHDIVESWIDSNMGHLESNWDEAGGEQGGFQEMIESRIAEIEPEEEDE